MTTLVSINVHVPPDKEVQVRINSATQGDEVLVLRDGDKVERFISGNQELHIKEISKGYVWPPK